MIKELRKQVKLSRSPEETQTIAEELAKSLPSSATLCFFGEMGAGKTTFIKALAGAFGIDPHHVTSPTFTYLNLYSGTVPFYHFDLWRLKGEQAFLDQGFDEFFTVPGIRVIEWSEKIVPLLPKDRLNITIEVLGEFERRWTFEEVCS